MEKVKITREQLVALGHFRKNRCVLTDFLYGQENFAKEYFPLKTIQPEDFAKVLCGWYEVEQTFEAGDWVKGELSGCYAKLERTSEGSFRVTYADGKSDLYANCDFDKYFEKITEQWKIMLLKLGREKPEFNEKDIIVTESEVYEAEYLTDEEIIVLFERDLVRDFHAAEHRIEVKGHDS